jgi:hypothetical protein
LPGLKNIETTKAMINANAYMAEILLNKNGTGENSEIKASIRETAPAAISPINTDFIIMFKCILFFKGFKAL